MLPEILVWPLPAPASRGTGTSLYIAKRTAPHSAQCTGKQGNAADVDFSRCRRFPGPLSVKARLKSPLPGSHGNLHAPLLHQGEIIACDGVALYRDIQLPELVCSLHPVEMIFGATAGPVA